MTLRHIGACNSGYGSEVDCEFDSITTVSGGIFRAVAQDINKFGYTVRAYTGATSGSIYGTTNWGYDDNGIYVKILFYFTAVPTAIQAFFSVLDSSDNQLFSLRVNASGYYQVNNNANSTVYTSTVSKPVANTWQLLNFYWKNGTSDGAFTFKIANGASGEYLDTDLTQTGLNNGTAGCRKYRFGVVEAMASSKEVRLAFLAINSNDGSLNNSWLTNYDVVAIPLGSSDLANWTVVDGGSANWQALDELPFASLTTDLIKSSTANQEERMGLRSLGAGGSSIVIAGLLPIIRHSRTVAGSAAGVTIGIRSGSTDGTMSGTIDSGSTTFKTYRGVIQETDPNTSAAWTLSGVNNAKLKILHDSGTNEARINAAFVYMLYSNLDATTASEALVVDSRTSKIIKGTIVGMPRIAEGRGRRGHKM